MYGEDGDTDFEWGHGRVGVRGAAPRRRGVEDRANFNVHPCPAHAEERGRVDRELVANCLNIYAGILKSHSSLVLGRLRLGQYPSTKNMDSKMWVQKKPLDY